MSYTPIGRSTTEKAFKDTDMVDNTKLDQTDSRSP